MLGSPGLLPGRGVRHQSLGCGCELNCDPPKNSYVEVLTRHVIIFRDGACGKVLRLHEVMRVDPDPTGLISYMETH